MEECRKLPEVHIHKLKQAISRKRWSRDSGLTQWAEDQVERSELDLSMFSLVRFSRFFAELEPEPAVRFSTQSELRTEPAVRFSWSTFGLAELLPYKVSVQYFLLIF